MISLDKLTAGKSAKVVSIEGGANFISKLYNLGLKEGSVIRKITTASSQDPVVIKLGGRTQVALGIGMASRVMVEPL